MGLGSKCLVTGGAGFIGSHVAECLVAQGYDVVVLDDLSGGYRSNVPQGAAFIQGSITDATLVGRLFGAHKFDYVFHLAAYAAEGLSHFIRRYNYVNNLVGSINLINEAVKAECKCFVFTSSIAVYGANQLPMTEETVPMPEDPYGIAKYAVELDLEAAHRMFGLNYVVFRPHNVYGERQNLADPYRNVLGIFMRQVMLGEEMTVFGDGSQTRAFTYIADVAPAIADSAWHLKAYNTVYNIGASEPRSVGELARLVAAGFGKSVQLKHLPERKEVKHAFSSHDKVQRVFGVTAQWSLEAGIERMAQWAKGLSLPPPKTFQNIEVYKNMPPSWAKLCNR